MVGQKVEIKLQWSIPIGIKAESEPFWHEAEVLSKTDDGIIVGFYFDNGSLLNPRQKYFKIEVNNKQYRWKRKS